MAKSKKLGEEWSDSRQTNIEIWMGTLIKHLYDFGPRCVAEVREEHRDVVVDTAERFGLVQRWRLMECNVLAACIKTEAYREWLKSNRNKPPRPKPSPASLKQLMARGKVVRHLVETENFNVVSHESNRISKLVDPDAKTVHLIVNGTGYAPSTVRKVLKQGFENGPFVKDAVIIGDRRPKIVKNASKEYGDYIRVIDIRTVVPR